jgi:hypothetical protein
MPPGKIWILSTLLGAVHFSIFASIYFTQSHDAQWQLAYLPFSIVDFPISILYTKCPFLLGEGILGSTWWFILPILMEDLAQSKEP